MLKGDNHVVASAEASNVVKGQWVVIVGESARLWRKDNKLVVDKRRLVGKGRVEIFWVEESLITKFSD